MRPKFRIERIKQCLWRLAQSSVADGGLYPRPVEGPVAEETAANAFCDGVFGMVVTRLS